MRCWGPYLQDTIVKLIISYGMCTFFIQVYTSSDSVGEYCNNNYIIDCVVMQLSTVTVYLYDTVPPQ